jgi:hypothetical protein
MKKSLNIELPVLLAIIYLLIPFLCFLGYLNPILLIAIGSLISLIGYRLAKRFSIKRLQINKSVIILIIITAFVIALISGNLSFIWGIEQGDWYKHNTILNDLVTLDWPVRYDIGYSLNYYLGLYLFPALIGKLFGSYYIAKIALGLWVSLGLFIGLLNIYNLYKLGKNNKLVLMAIIILLFVFSGIDVLRPILKYHSLPLPGEHIEWSQTFRFYLNVDRGDGTKINIATVEGDPLQYPSIITSLAWAPQHFMPIVLILPILFRKKYKITLLLMAISLIWSPFASLGIGLSTIIQLITNFKINRKYNVRSIIGYCALLLVFAAPQIYFYSRHVDVSFPVIPIASFENWYMFILTEVSPLVFIYILLFKFLDKSQRVSALLLLIILLFLPMFRFGWQAVSDLILRTSTPLIFSLLLIYIQGLLKVDDKVRIFIVGLLFFIGVITPFNEVYRIGQGALMLPYSDNIASPDDMNLRQQYYLQYLGK